MDKAIVSVGMGTGQFEFIKKAKAKGYKVIAFGKGKNSEDAMAIADYTREIDTTDQEGAIAWIDTLPVEVAGVGSMAGGRAIETVQKLASYYKVCTAVPNHLIVGNDKINQMKLYMKYGLSSIQTWRAAELPDDLDDNIKYIIKPAKGRGSEGIRIVTRSELMQNIAIKYLDDDDVIQTVVVGEEYRCLVMFQDGEIVFTAPVYRESYANTVFLGRLKYDDKCLERLEKYFASFIKKSGLRNGVLKADVLVSDIDINMIEMDIGVGGGIYYQTFLADLYERDIVSDYIDIIVNDPVVTYRRPSKKLAMDYVYNTKEYSINYSIDKCKEVLDDVTKCTRIQINALHPENKGGFNSNADFVLAVIYECDEEYPKDAINKLLNEKVFIKRG